MTRQAEHPEWKEAAPACPEDRARLAAVAARGTILIVTMWIVLVLAGMVLVLARAMRVEGGCSANEVAELQADAIEQGAVQYVLSSVDSLQGQVPTEADMPCEAIRVGDGLFWIIRPTYDDDRSFACGLVDEASKLNVNTASQSMLSNLPDITSELAASIIDWRDADENITSGGGESEYYMRLSDPYQCKDGPLETVEELFLVKGATRDILYGEDLNRNNVLDPNEDDGDVSDPPDNRDGKLDRGLLAFVTVYSSEPNVAADGSARVDVNVPRSQTLSALLNKNLSSGRAAVVLARSRLNMPFTSALDFCVRCGMTTDETTLLVDKLTAGSAKTLKGLINVNTAPQEVLTCLPGLNQSDVAALVGKRTSGGTSSSSSSSSSAAPDTVAWVLGALTPVKAAVIGGFITARSYQFSADIVSVAGNGRAFRRCRIVVDATTSPPRVVYRQNLTHMGWPLPDDILDGLRAGGSVDQFSTGWKVGTSTNK